MTTARLLRIDAVIFLLFAVGHWFFSPWTIGVEGQALDALSAAAKTNYPVFGFMRSYWDFHVGFGHMVGVALLMEAALLWLLAGRAGGISRRERRRNIPKPRARFRRKDSRTGAQTSARGRP